MVLQTKLIMNNESLIVRCMFWEFILERYDCIIISMESKSYFVQF